MTFLCATAHYLSYKKAHFVSYTVVMKAIYLYFCWENVFSKKQEINIFLGSTNSEEVLYHNTV